MSLLFRTSIAGNEVVKNVSIVKRRLWAPPSRNLRIQERQQSTRWGYRQNAGGINRRSIGFSSRNGFEKQHCVVHQTAFPDICSKQSYPRCKRQLSTTTTNSDSKEKESNDSKTDQKPLRMPDKDTELQLADLQATITDEYKQGNFKRALSSSQNLLKQTQEHFGFNVDHPATASAMNNVGLMHKLLGNFTEARQHYVGAMRIYASVCGRDHASYAMTLHNIGNLNKSQVHFDTSLKATERLSLVEASMEYLEEAFAIRNAELGAGHPHTIATRSAIGSTLAAQVLYQHKMVEATAGEDQDSNNTRKQYVALDPQGITQQHWRLAEEHLRASLQMAIDNPRGRQIQKNNHRKNQKGNKRKGSKQYIKPQKNTSKSGLLITTLSAASAAQNLAVFLKSLGMTFEEDSSLRKQHLHEAKDLYEKAQEVRSQLLPYDHPDLYATKYSLAELLDVLALAPGGKSEEERQKHEEAANTLRQEIIDTYDPPNSAQEEQDSNETKAGPLDVVVQKIEGSRK